MTTRIKIDEVSLLAAAPVEMALCELEMGLRQRGYTLGYEPILPVPAKKTVSLRRVLEERVPNGCALRYGEIDDLCVSLKVRRRPGGVVVTKNVPRSATGPDFKKIFIGSKSRYGKILKATLRIVRLPEKQEGLELSWRDPQKRLKFLRRLSTSGVRPVRVEKRGRRGLKIIIEGMSLLVRAERECLKRLTRETQGRLKDAIK